MKEIYPGEDSRVIDLKQKLNEIEILIARLSQKDNSHAEIRDLRNRLEALTGELQSHYSKLGSWNTTLGIFQAEQYAQDVYGVTHKVNKILSGEIEI